jgi:hypothetical protein
MAKTRQDLEARTALFERFALNDQRNYYKTTVARYRKAAGQVNWIRALMALLTGIAAAAASTIVSATPQCTVAEPAPECAAVNTLTAGLAVAAIILPAIAALFGTLADLFQWDRLVTIYDDALLNIELADAQSPDLEIEDDVTYHAAYLAFCEGTLSVMNDESAQWGQSIRTPAQIEKYIEDAKRRAETQSGQSTTTEDGAGG